MQYQGVLLINNTYWLEKYLLNLDVLNQHTRSVNIIILHSTTLIRQEQLLNMAAATLTKSYVGKMVPSQTSDNRVLFDIFKQAGEENLCCEYINLQTIQRTTSNNVLSQVCLLSEILLLRLLISFIQLFPVLMHVLKMFLIQSLHSI